MLCPSCGAALLEGQQFCPLCGARTQAISSPTPKSGPQALAMVGGGCLGLLGGPFLIAVGSMLGVALSRGGNETKYTMPIWLLETLALGCGVIFLFTSSAKRSIPQSLRAFLLGLAFVALGGLALCEFIIFGAAQSK